MAVRVFLTERISIEGRGVVLDEQRFPGRQGRLVFAYLLAVQGRPVPRDELAAALWGDEPPARWEKALSVLISKLRALLTECGIDGSAALTSAFGCYVLALPEGSWIDIVAADEAARAAEDALAADEPDRALANASAAVLLARRTFLPGEDGLWVGERRAGLREILVRALESLAEAHRLAGDPSAAVRAADELVTRDPFRERGYRLLMQAQSDAGNDAEALRVYERCRELLAEELGAYPSPETEAVYLDILRGSARAAGADPPTIDGLPTAAAPAAASRSRRSRRWPAALLGAMVLVGVVAAVAVVTGGDDGSPPEVLPNSVVRIDPETLQQTQVIEVGKEPDLVVVAGGYVWVTHSGRRYTGSNTVTNTGDRTLTRIDPSTGETRPVGGGVAPCGLTADPSGDVWVANCFAPGSGQGANVVRIDAKTLKFESTRPVRAGLGYFRGLVYGGGWLWVADVSGAVDYHGITKVDPRTALTQRIELDRHAGWLSWSDGYGDLWMNDFNRSSVSRLDVATGAVETFEAVGVNPAAHVADGDAVWVGDWANPWVIRLPAVGSGAPVRVALPVSITHAGVTDMDAGGGAVWATVPDSHALWRVDTKSRRVTRVELGYFPWGVAYGDDGIWVAVRAKVS